MQLSGIPKHEGLLSGMKYTPGAEGGRARKKKKAILGFSIQ
jgi:hypothetical protein